MLASFTDTWFEVDLRPNVRRSVEPADLERWAAEGAALSLDEAVAFALEISTDELATLGRSDTD